MTTMETTEDGMWFATEDGEARARFANWYGDARLYKLSEPLPYHCDSFKGSRDTRYVLVSVARRINGCFMISVFPANEEGDPIALFPALRSEYKEGRHESALRNLNYAVVPKSPLVETRNEEIEEWRRKADAWEHLMYHYLGDRSSLTALDPWVLDSIKESAAPGLESIIREAFALSVGKRIVDEEGS